ncbi:proton extrusion protein PcxA [Pannus brasiliensis CCIBt3594]|uniref:Proton extrusion protein PxcA n=1 Tax=Pannus brasiliensis CCIBt3594 TaxID=1427578 RepID=A0AAW9QZG6_9CHRO
MNFNRILQTANQWLLKTPDRSLDSAYRAALKIKDIEDKHFQGRKVSGEFSNYGGTVNSYFISEVKRHLQKVRVRLIEFRASRAIVDTFGPRQPLSTGSEGTVTIPNDIWLEKLNIIDSIVIKYQESDRFETNEEIALAKDSAIVPVRERENKTKNRSTRGSFLDPRFEAEERLDRSSKLQKATERPGVLPRSFVNTLNRIKQEIDPQSEESEEAVLRKFRNSRYKTAISIKFILLLIIVPLLTHQLSKTFLITPLVHKYFAENQEFVFINRDLEEEAFADLKRYEEALHFRGLIGLSEKLNPEEIEERVKEKAGELSQEYRLRGLDGISNIFSDIFSFIAFGFVIAFSRREIEIVKGFLDGILYNLSDSAKAFLIILFTDMFVGFHSPHGWEVILENLGRHFGLPENRDFNFLFIATFPVILDTVLKYWIFRYLNRISPSAVATYRNMNE